MHYISLLFYFLPKITVAICPISTTSMVKDVGTINNIENKRE